jgi:diguanylate cyclase (GGDEF)-like protein/PAS domain S-box-containing protein
MQPSGGAFQPFAFRARGTIAAILATLALVSALSAVLSIWTTGRSKNGAALVEVAARQRTLAERYVADVELARSGKAANPARTASLLAASAHALLEGGGVPAVDGDDDEMDVPAVSDPVARAQLMQEQRLVVDLSRTGSALLAGRNVRGTPLTAHEHIVTKDPVLRLRVLAALTSNVALNAARTIAQRTDRNVTSSIRLQVGLGLGGLVISLLLAWALIATTRRQTAHFRTLVSSSTDLVLVFGRGGCRYVSQSVVSLIGRPEAALFGQGFMQVVHPDDRQALEAALEAGHTRELVFRVGTSGGEWRHLEAHLTDLRRDRHVHGILVNARDITERVELEEELTRQARRDSFGRQLTEALEMADEEESTYDVVELAMAQISPEAPSELLLSDSSRANLERAAVSPVAGAAGCPVQSPFSCVAVRRGTAVVFDSSEALNACPKLRDRPTGACSAVCVPVSFMGRSLGVLHTTGPEHAPPDAEQVSKLATLATQAGARIGTVRAFERTQLQASTDSLTGLVNRRTLERQLRGLVKQGRPFAVALADLDHFKKLNDRHGHEAGDRALRAFAQVARGALRDDDTVARWGGEEFMFVLPDLDRHQTVSVLERIRTILADTHTGGGHPPFTASFGVTDSTRADTLDDLIRLADLGLYAAKEAGRDSITISETLPEAPDLTVVPEPAKGNGEPARARRRRPAIHEAAQEDDPQASGHEIR